MPSWSLGVLVTLLLSVEGFVAYALQPSVPPVPANPVLEPGTPSPVAGVVVESPTGGASTTPPEASAVSVAAGAGMAELRPPSFPPVTLPPGLTLPAASTPVGTPSVRIPPAPVPGAVLSSRTTSYDMTLELDPLQRQLKGEQRITWINRSPEPIQEVQLHLYWNAFKNDRTSFARGLQGRGMRFKRGKQQEADWGYVDLLSFRQQGQELVKGLEFIQPDDQNPDDQTVARIPLAIPVQPGEQVVFETRFEARVPHILARAGVKNDFYFMGQFFPKLGVLEYPGLRYATQVGWNCHQYHSRSEYYADFGNYDVKLTVPSAFVVGATGQLQTAQDNGNGTTTHHYKQTDVIDFAWTAWPGFKELTQRFEAAGMPSVSVRFLFPEEYRQSALSSVRATMVALESAGRRFFPYPHPTLTVVVPPYGADEAGGMEYPTLITTWGKVFPGNSFGSDSTTIHEFGHQYFQGMLASNEFEESWLDEGINSYATDLMMRDGDYRLRLELRPIGRLPVMLPSSVETWLWKRSILLVKLNSPMQTAAWKFRSGGDYGINSYTRPSMTLEALSAYLGEPTMRQLMQLYTRRHAFSHPTAQDFFQAAREVAGQPLDWFFQQFVLGNQRLDLAVSEVFTREVRPGTGYFSGHGEKATLRTPPPGHSEASDDDDDEQEEPASDASSDASSDTSGNASGNTSGNASPAAAVVAADTPTRGEGAAEEADGAASAAAHDKKGKSAKLYYSEVVVENREQALFPTELLVVFEDGTELREQWDGSGGWKRFRYERNSKLVRAELDPDGRMLMDRDPLNNGRRVEQNGLSASRLRYMVHHVATMLLSALMMLV